MNTISKPPRSFACTLRWTTEAGLPTERDALIELRRGAFATRTVAAAVHQGELRLGLQRTVRRNLPGQTYRVIVVRKNLKISEPKQNRFFDAYRYFFYISNDWQSPPEQIVFSRNENDAPDQRPPNFQEKFMSV